MCQPLSLGSAAFSFFEWHWFSNSPARPFRGFSHKTNKQKDSFCCCCSWNCSFNFYAWQIRPAKNLTIELTRERIDKKRVFCLLFGCLYLMLPSLISALLVLLVFCAFPHFCHPFISLTLFQGCDILPLADRTGECHSWRNIPSCLYRGAWIKKKNPPLERLNISFLWRA